MSPTRHELHRLVDAVADDKLPEVAEVLRDVIQPDESSAHQRGSLSFVATLSGGPTDLAEHHTDYLRDLFARTA